MKDVRTLSTHFVGSADTKIRQKHYEKRKVRINHYRMIKKTCHEPILSHEHKCKIFKESISKLI